MFENRLDPALRPFAGARTDLSASVLGVVRDSLNQRRAESSRGVNSVGVDIEKREVGRIPVRIYRGGAAPAPAVIYCHSGAFVLGNLDTDHRQCVEFARRGRCTVISVDYRLAPEDGYPAALDDVATVLAWTRTKPPVVFQLLHQPVLDDRPTPSKDEFVSTPGLDGPAVTQMWRHYLAGESVPADAVPARADELTGVASTLITCSELDPLRDEAIDYALRLMWAGVTTELHVFPGTCHGFDSLLPEWEISQQLFELQGAALRRALHHIASSRTMAAW
jgi:acetyl esterase